MDVVMAALWLLMRAELAKEARKRGENLLSTGAIAAIYRGEHVECPVLQFLSYKRSCTREDNWTERWHIKLSDGDHCCYATCADKHKQKLKSRKLDENDLIRLKNYTYNGGHIFIQEMRTVKRDIEDIIGDPSFIDGPELSRANVSADTLRPSTVTGSPQAEIPSTASRPPDSSGDEESHEEATSVPARSLGEVKPAQNTEPSKGASSFAKFSEVAGSSQSQMGAKPSAATASSLEGRPSSASKLSGGDEARSIPARPSAGNEGPSEEASSFSNPLDVAGSTQSPTAAKPSIVEEQSGDLGPAGDAGPPGAGTLGEAGSSEATPPPATVTPDVDLGTAKEAGPSEVGDSCSVARPSEAEGPFRSPERAQGPISSRYEKSDKEERLHQGLMCPLCLDAFKSPTLLACGHTFCKDCLDSYDDPDKHKDYMECPVCRKRTKLAEDRVAGLPANFSLKVLDDEIRGQGEGESVCTFCPLHRNVLRDIYCVDCSEFICLTCFLDKHQGHGIKKKEELDAHLQKKRDALLQKSRGKKAEIDKSISDAELYRIGVQNHFANLKKEVKAASLRKIKILQGNTLKLQTKLDEMQSYHDKLLTTCITDQKESTVTLSSSLTILAGTTSKCSDSDSFKAHQLQLSELADSLTKIPDPVSTAHVLETAQMTKFMPNKIVPDVGEIELGEEAPASLVEGAKTVHILRKIRLSHIMSGMAALSQNAVVIHFGWSGGWGKPGTYCFFVSGANRPHITTRQMGALRGVAILSDRSLVISSYKGKSCCYRFDPRHPHDLIAKYTCKQGTRDAELCSDHNDNIYAVNGNTEIYIFHGKNPEPQRVVSTGDVVPNRICVAKTGVMIVGSYCARISTITTYDRDGRVGSTISARHQDEELYATVDPHDRVLVARVVHKEHMLTLTRYTLEGSKLVDRVVFKQLHFSDQKSVRSELCYMVSLTHNLVAFGHGIHLLFIKLT